MSTVEDSRDSSPATGPASPGTPSALRAANTRRVLDALRADHGLPREGEPVSQPDLARLTGLAPATVSSIVRDLAAQGLVETHAGSGRRGTTVRLARAAGAVAGIDFGHQHLAVAVGTVDGVVLAEDRIPLATELSHQRGLDAATRLLDALLAAEGFEGTDLRAIGMGIPAPIADGTVRSSTILPGWVGVDVRSVVQTRWDVPVHVENDANLGALAEHRHGAARGQDSSVYIKVSSGVGAGIILNDELFHGTTGAAGEVGHLTFDEQGPVCRCGSRGCLEAYASTGAVLDLMSSRSPDGSLDQIAREAREGNVSARRVFEDAGLHLGWGIASVVNLLNPGLVVIGGEMARAGELFFEPARIGLRRHALDAVASTPVVASELGERASLEGAVVLAAEHVDLIPQ